MKNELRKQAKCIKTNLDLDGISVKIQNRLISSGVFDGCNTAMLYMALDDEIKTDILFRHLLSIKCDCCFPVVNGENIIIKKCSEKGFLKGTFGIYEPVGEIVSAETVDIVVVPGVMFDVNHARLGRGGGYYDRLLRKMHAKKIGICADELLVDHLPSEAHDVGVDMIITEKRVV